MKQLILIALFAFSIFTGTAQVKVSELPAVTDTVENYIDSLQLPVVQGPSQPAGMLKTKKIFGHQLKDAIQQTLQEVIVKGSTLNIPVYIESTGDYYWISIATPGGGNSTLAMTDLQSLFFHYKDSSYTTVSLDSVLRLHNGTDMHDWNAANIKIFRDSIKAEVMDSSVGPGYIITRDGVAFKNKSNEFYRFPLAQPESGQVLKATSPSQLDWADESGGSSGGSDSTVYKTDGVQASDRTWDGNGKFLYLPNFSFIDFMATNYISLSAALKASLNMNSSGASFNYSNTNNSTMAINNNGFNAGGWTTGFAFQTQVEARYNYARFFAASPNKASLLWIDSAKAIISTNDSIIQIPKIKTTVLNESVKAVVWNPTDKTLYVADPTPINIDTNYLKWNGDTITLKNPPPKECIFSVSQSGTGAPVVTVIKNDLSVTPVFSYEGAGSYVSQSIPEILAMGGAFDKLEIWVTNYFEPSTGKAVLAQVSADEFILLVSSDNTDTVIDGVFGNMSIAGFGVKNIIHIIIHP